MKPNWIDLGSLDDLPEGTPVLRKAEGQRFVCVRRGEQVDALDDRCPHQGYPLSQGSLRDGVLTCEWHNWKFEIESGACTFGGEPVRRFPSRVEGGRVKLDLAIDTAAEFIVATNNYRGSGGGSFPGLNGSNVIYASPDANRDVLIDYIKARRNLTFAADGSARSWRFTPVSVAGPVTFKSASGKLGVATALGLGNISVLRDDDGSGKGLGVYAIDLSR